MFDRRDVRSVELDSVTTSTNIAADPGDGKKVVILGLVLTADAGSAADVTITDGTNAFCTAMATAQLVLPMSDLGWYEATASEAVTISADVAVSGHVRYVVVDA